MRARRIGIEATWIDTIVVYYGLGIGVSGWRFFFLFVRYSLACRNVDGKETEDL